MNARHLAWSLLAVPLLGCGKGGGGGGGSGGGNGGPGAAMLLGTYAIAGFEVRLSEENASFPLGGFTGTSPEATATQVHSNGGDVVFDGSGGLGGTAADTSARLLWDEAGEGASGNVSAPGCGPVAIAGGTIPRNGFTLSTDSGGGPVAGSYSITGDGLLTITSEETLSGAVDASGRIAAAASYDAVEGRAGITVVVERSPVGSPPTFGTTVHFVSVGGRLEIGGNHRHVFSSGHGTLTMNGASSGTFGGAAADHRVLRTIGESQQLHVAPVTFPCGSGGATVTVYSDDLPAPVVEDSSSTPAGTFSVTSEGLLTVSTDDTLQGVLGVGGTFGVLHDDRDAADSADRGFILLLAAPSGLAPTPLTGAYRFVGVEVRQTGTDRTAVSSGTLTFHPNGVVVLAADPERGVTRQVGGGFGNAALSFSIAPTAGGFAASSVTTFSIAGDTGAPSSDQGTYSVSPTGVVTMQLGGSSATGYLSHDLGTLVVPSAGPGLVGMSIAFKKP